MLAKLSLRAGNSIVNSGAVLALGLGVAGCSGPSSPERLTEVSPTTTEAVRQGNTLSLPTTLVTPTLDLPTTTAHTLDIPTTTEASQGSYTVIFDNLGSTETDIIKVYKGSGETAHDKEKAGTFKDGQSTQAFCQTLGRLVTSDEGADELKRSSIVWVSVDGAPGQESWATATYLEEPLPELPQC